MKKLQRDAIDKLSPYVPGKPVAEVQREYGIADIIKMASILEEEARTMETRQIVAGILWKRLALGMPLQVASSFKYNNIQEF